MRAQARTLTPVQLRQEKHGDTDLRCSQGLRTGAGLPDSWQRGSFRRTLPIQPGFCLDNVEIGATRGGRSTLVAQQKIVQTCICPSSVGVDRSLREGGVRWIDGTVECKLLSAMLLYPSTEHQAQGYCAEAACSQGEWPDAAGQQAKLSRIGQGVWSICSFRNQTRRTGESQAVADSPRPLEVGQLPLAEMLGEGGCHNVEKWTPSSVLLFRQDFTGMTFRKANAARQADSAYGIAMA